MRLFTFVVDNDNIVHVDGNEIGARKTHRKTPTTC
jgi:hypothetical protein